MQLSLPPTPIANSFPAYPDEDAARYPLDVQECLTCGHVQLREHVAVDWVDYRYRTPEQFRPHLAESADSLRQRYPDSIRVCEIGSNNGVFLEELQKVGFEAFGVDPNATSGIRAEFSYGLASTLEPVDLIVANNVLAHVDDFWDVFRGIDRLLKDEGALIFEVQYLPGMMASGAFDMIYHEHRDYHTLKPWPSFLKRFGLVIERVEFLDVHSGSVRVTCTRPGRGLDFSEEEDLDWRGFKRRIRLAKQAVQEQLLEVDGPIAAFGATAKATTLLHAFGLADFLDYCVDGTTAKQGRYLPGTRIPIHAPSMLQERPPAAILLTAWNYAERILADYPDYHFIIPFTQEAPCPLPEPLRAN